MSCWLNRWSCLVSIRADYYRYYGHRQLRLAFFKYLIVDLRLRQCVIFRILSCYDSRRRLVKILLFPLAIYYRHLKLITGIQLSAGTRIRNGLVFEHWGGVVITHCAIIGENCTIAQNVTIGWSKRGANRGTPVIGSNVFIGPGAVILGNIKINVINLSHHRVGL